jgi:hypothetical protein
MRFIIGLVISFLVWTSQSCKEVLPVRQITGSIDTSFLISNIPDPQSKVVLFEEFTGANCPNCPDGHNIVKDVLTQYGSKVAVVGLHPANNGLAKPLNNAEDYRTNDAEQIGKIFALSALPSGAIDRKSYDGSVVQDRFVWKQRVESAISSPVKINTKSKVYLDNFSGQKFLELEFTLLEDIPSELNFSIMLIENKLMAPQKLGSQVLDPYEHGHVLRKMYTSALGNVLSKVESDGGGYKKGRVFVKKLKLEDFSQTKYKEENLYLVSFVSNAANREVYQTTVSKVKI